MCYNINKIKLKLIFWEWVDVNWMNGDVFDLMIIGVRVDMVEENESRKSYDYILRIEV